MTASQSRPALIDSHEPPLSAPLKLSFDYTRSVGPTLSAFFTALRDRHIVGVVSLVLTGIVPYTQLNVGAPVAVAVDSLGK